LAYRRNGNQAVEMVIRGPKCKALRFLTRRELTDIHSASLQILEQVGMHSSSERILNIFDDSGANVDFKERRIRIHQHLIEEALKKAPRLYILHGRNPKHDILVEDGRIYFGQGGTPVPYIRDRVTGDLRRPTKNDVAEAAQLADALSNMSFVMNIAGAYDVPCEVEYLHEFDALFNNTEKPIIYVAPSIELVSIVEAMASAIVEGSEELRKRPIFSVYCETASPLSFPMHNDNIIYCAKAGIPITLGPVPLIGGTAPATLAGAITVANAESLAALTLSQLAGDHTPVNYAAWAATMDPRTGIACYAAPEHALTFGAINGQLASYYDLPSFGVGGAVDSKLPDVQAGCEMSMQSLTSALSGVTLIHDFGYLASGCVGSMEMAVICNEVIGYILRVVRGISVDDEHLAVDVIKEVGPLKHYLAHKHTLEFLEREIYLPTLFDRRNVDSWVKSGKKDISQTAREKVREIRREHKTEPLPREVRQKIREIVKEAEKKLVKKSWRGTQKNLQNQSVHEKAF
jgi:trimethylamine--corrinoid protein Co-methyltransferase